MTGLLGADPEAVRAAVRAVRPRDDDRDDAFARGAWTGIAEPGDGVAGALVEAYGAVDALGLLAQDAPPTADRAVAAGFERWRPRVDAGAALRAFRNAAHLGIRLLLPGDASWPAGLADLGAHAPLALWALGRGGALDALARSIALVGARAATGYGEQVTAEAAAGLCDQGIAIVSGAAYGIDGTAHRAALASGGTTVAVLAGGLDRFYPSGHAALLQRIVRDGAVLAELPCGFAPTKWRFLQRNRLIAAMSGATVVLEAGARSGSLNTAGHAAAIGRPLGAVPGSVFSAASAGCHRLLREYDAVCVRDADDMVELLIGADGEQPTLPGLEPALDPLERRVLDALGRTPRSPLEVARSAGVSVGDAVAALGMLELAGSATESAGGWALRP